MSIKEPDTEKKIATESPQKLSEREPETPEVGIGLMLLGGLCLLLGVVIGLVFTGK